MKSAFFQLAAEIMGPNKAEEFVQSIRSSVNTEFDNQKAHFLTKDDKVDILRSIYLVGLGQFLGVVVSVLAIVNFLLK